MSRILHPEFRDEQGPTKYPFSDDATLLSTDNLAIHPAAFIDASAYPQGGGPNLGIRQIDTRERSVTVWVGDDGDAKRCSGSFDRLEPSDSLALADADGRPSGVLIMDPLHVAAFQTWPIGDHVFPQKAATFVANCTIPMPKVGVRGFKVGDKVVTGDVWLIGEHGVVLRASDDHTIRVDVVGDPMFRRKLCGPLELFHTPRFVRTINGVPPDPFGNFNFTAGGNDSKDSILRIRPVPPDTLVLEIVGKGVKGG